MFRWNGASRRPKQIHTPKVSPVCPQLRCLVLRETLKLWTWQWTDQWRCSRCGRLQGCGSPFQYPTTDEMNEEKYFSAQSTPLWKYTMHPEMKLLPSGERHCRCGKMQGRQCRTWPSQLGRGRRTGSRSGPSSRDNFLATPALPRQRLRWLHTDRRMSPGPTQDMGGHLHALETEGRQRVLWRGKYKFWFVT